MIARYCGACGHEVPPEARRARDPAARFIVLNDKATSPEVAQDTCQTRSQSNLLSSNKAVGLFVMSASKSSRTVFRFDTLTLKMVSHRFSLSPLFVPSAFELGRPKWVLPAYPAAIMP